MKSKVEEVDGMRDFYEFDEHNHKSGFGAFKVVLFALVFTLIGATLMYYLTPYINKNEIAMGIEKDNGESKPSIIQNEQNNQKQNESTTSLLSAEGDLFISSENPVVEIAEKVGPAVVGITNRSIVRRRDFFFGTIYEQEQEGYGSGIIISKEGYIVTNYHVIENAKEIMVILQGGKEVEAKLIGADPTTDIAVVKIDEPNLTVAKLGDSDKVKPGELAVAIGNPMGHELAGTVTVGVISAVNRVLEVDGRRLKLLQTDAAINPGNSGGALINARGEVIGMNTLKTGGVSIEGLGFAIPSNEFKPIVEALIEKGVVERPAIGITGYEITEQESKDAGYPQGILVRSILKNGPAAKAGILPGDVITGFDGKQVKTFDELREGINKHKVGDEVNIDIWRDGKEYTLRIKLEQMQ